MLKCETPKRLEITRRLFRSPDFKGKEVIA
jgi:hypothetical protein